MSEQQPLVQADLDAVLAGFDRPPIMAVASSTTPGLPSDMQLQQEPIDNEAEENDDQEAEVSGEDESATTESSQDEEVLGSPEFIKQFTDVFGIEPQEAIETVNTLTAFRDEMQLMSEWNLTPAAYRERMGQVREFYQTLPEEGQSKFNSIDGALAIWKHIEGNSLKTPTKSSVKPAATSGKAKAPKQEIFKKSEVLRMDKDTYRKNLGRIQKAVLEGRFVEDV